MSFYSYCNTFLKLVLQKDSSMKSKSLIMSLAVMVLGTTVLAGCSAGVSKPAVAQDKNASITVWVDDTRTQPAKDYLSAHPDVKAEVVSVDNTHGNISSQISLASKAGKDVPDVVFLSYPDEIASLVTNPVNYPLALNDAVGKKTLDGFAAGSTSACTFGGKVYCLPNDLAQTVLYYNKALFDQFGYTVPTTFDDWLTLGEKLATEHPGYSLGSVSSRYGLNGYYGSSQCKFNDSSDPTTVTIDTAADECTRVNKVVGPLLANKTLSTLDPFDPAFVPLIADGKLLATISPAWMGEYGIKPNFAQNGQWAVAAMPTWAGAKENTSGAVGGGIWIVSSKSKNQEAAVKFAEAMTTDIDIQSKSSGYPAFTTAADAWLKAAASDPWYASDPTDVYKAAAAQISPTLGFVRYQVQLEDSFNATILKNGATDIDGALKEFGSQANSAAESAGYTVKTK